MDLHSYLQSCVISMNFWVESLKQDTVRRQLSPGYNWLEIIFLFQSFRDSVTSLEQTVVPHHDYFSAQFLLSFDLPTVYHVTVSSSVIDSSGIKWNTGPQSSLQVKTSDTAARKQRTSRS